MSALADVRFDGTRSVTAGGGALWSEVVTASLARGLTPPVLTDYLRTTVGGTLSTGGIGGASQHFGTQTDVVTELEVVTGTGALVTCSSAHEPELFDVARAGLGQFGIVVGATLELVAGPRSVRRWSLPYRSPRDFRRDAERLVRERRCDHLEGQVLPLGGTWRHVLEVAVYGDGQDSDSGRLLDGLSHETGGVEVEDLAYADFANRLAEAERLFTGTGEWQWPHPWLNAFVPASSVEGVLAEITADRRHWPDAGRSSLVLAYPVPVSRLRTPMLARPHVDAHDPIWLVAILRAAPPGRRAAEEALAANRDVLGTVEEAGGRAYPVNATTAPSDWSGHYSGMWPVIVARKKQFDPRGILTPGQPVATALEGSNSSEEHSKP